MSLATRLAAGVVTVVTGTSLANALIPSSFPSTGNKADSNVQSSYVGSQGRQTENDRTRRIILQDSGNSDELASSELRPAEQDTAEDVVRSLSRRP